LDHIVPLAKGGTHTWNNVQCTCRRCNAGKAAKVIGQMLLFGDHRRAQVA
jgi:5-methylcytosine-specific restriction endonuclease McrA